MTEQIATISRYQAVKIELEKTKEELKQPKLTYELYAYLKQKKEILQEKLDEMSLFEVWYDFYDGSMADLNGYQERVEVYTDKEKALRRIDELNGDDWEKPYYLKVVESNEGCGMSKIKKFNIPKHINLKTDKYGDLTVEGARDVLNELVKAGYKDYKLLIGYDGNLAYTRFTDDIEIDENHKKILVKE